MTLSDRFLNLIALLLGVPLTSLGAIMLLYISPGVVGKSVLIICQICLLSLPIIWRLKIAKKPLKIPSIQKQDWTLGIAIGLVMFVIILIIYQFFLEAWIDVERVRDGLKIIGDINPQEFILGGVYFTFINALFEEYFWRWFVYSRWEKIVSGKLAVIFSALCFTLHHTIGLIAFVDWRVVIVGSSAVFIAGCIWAEYYRRYRLIWGNYFSHLMADIALHLVAWKIFFG